MKNPAMERALAAGEALDVRKIGQQVGPGDYRIAFTPDVDYCDASTEQWIWSIGRHKTSGCHFAATDTRYLESPDYECVWLR